MTDHFDGEVIMSECNNQECRRAGDPVYTQINVIKIDEFWAEIDAQRIEEDLAWLIELGYTPATRQSR